MHLWAQNSIFNCTNCKVKSDLIPSRDLNRLLRLLLSGIFACFRGRHKESHGKEEERKKSWKCGFGAIKAKGGNKGSWLLFFLLFLEQKVMFSCSQWSRKLGVRAPWFGCPRRNARVSNKRPHRGCTCKRDHVSTEGPKMLGHIITINSYQDQSRTTKVET